MRETEGKTGHLNDYNSNSGSWAAAAYRHSRTRGQLSLLCWDWEKFQEGAQGRVLDYQRILSC